MKEYTASVEKYARAASAYRTALLRSNEDRRRHLLGEGHAVMRYAEAKIQRDEALKLLATRVWPASPMGETRYEARHSESMDASMAGLHAATKGAWYAHQSSALPTAQARRKILARMWEVAGVCAQRVLHIRKDGEHPLQG